MSILNRQITFFLSSCFSGFLLSRIEGVSGSPEKPLSDLGRLSYESYWKSVIIPLIFCDGKLRSEISVQEIAITTGIDVNDATATLEQLAAGTRLHPGNGRFVGHCSFVHLFKSALSNAIAFALNLSVETRTHAIQ